MTKDTITNISAPAAAKNGSPARNDMAMALPLAIAGAPDIAHHRTSGIHANVVRLFWMSSMDTVGPQSIRAMAPMKAARALPNREKRRNAPQPSRMMCASRKSM